MEESQNHTKSPEGNLNSPGHMLLQGQSSKPLDHRLSCGYEEYAWFRMPIWYYPLHPYHESSRNFGFKKSLSGPSEHLSRILSSNLPLWEFLSCKLCMLLTALSNIGKSLYWLIVKFSKVVFGVVDVARATKRMKIRESWSSSFP